MAPLLLLLAGCDGWPESTPPPPPAPPPEGSVARGELVRRQALAPPGPPADGELLRLGAERYAIYCTPCHGASGAGDGPITAHGPAAPRLPAGRVGRRHGGTQSVEIGRHVKRLLLGDAEIGHGRARPQGGRVAQPGHEIGRPVRQMAGDVALLRVVVEGRAHHGSRVAHAGDAVAGAAAILQHQLAHAFRVAAGDGEMRRRLLLLQARGQRQKEQQRTEGPGHRQVGARSVGTPTSSVAPPNRAATRNRET